MIRGSVPTPRSRTYSPDKQTGQRINMPREGSAQGLGCSTLSDGEQMITVGSWTPWRPSIRRGKWAGFSVGRGRELRWRWGETDEMEIRRTSGIGTEYRWVRLRLRVSRQRGTELRK